MDMNLKGKNAFVCGGSKGIGFASAEALAALGATVTLVARSEETLRAALQKLPTGQGQQHDYIAADFIDIDDTAERAKKHAAQKGAVHILVNNSGGPPPGAILAASVNDFAAVFAQHVMMSQLLVQAFAPGMKAAKYGRIVNIISTSVKQPIKGLGVSNTIRGAMASWSKTLAGELGAFGITVNNVLPGSTETGRMQEIIGSRAKAAGRPEADLRAEDIAAIPAGRFADPAEIGAAVAFLASPAASYINGINLPVDGGRTLSL